MTLKAILASCTDHIYVYDPEGRYLLVSEAGAGAIGIDASDMIGKTWRDLDMPPEIMEPFFEKVRSVFEGDSSLRELVSYPTIQGRRDYEYVLDPVKEEGRVVAVLALVREL